MTSSETIERASSISWRASSVSSTSSAGTGSRRTVSPFSPSKYRASRAIRSMTPWKFDSAPIGIWMRTVFRPSLLLSCAVTLSAFAPVRSILLMNASRGT